MILQYRAASPNFSVHAQSALPLRTFLFKTFTHVLQRIFLLTVCRLNVISFSRGRSWSNLGLIWISGKGSVRSVSAPQSKLHKSVFPSKVTAASGPACWTGGHSTRPTVWKFIRAGPAVWTRRCRSRVFIQSRAAVSPGVAPLEIASLDPQIDGSFNSQNRVRTYFILATLKKKSIL